MTTPPGIETEPREAPAPPAPPRLDKRSLLQRARSRLVKLAPKPIVRRLAAPYIAGETRGEAMALVHRLRADRGLCSTVDVLGEAVTHAGETAAFLDEYVSALEDLAGCEYANISVKLSALGQGIDDALCARNLEVLLRKAASVNQFVRFDMEDHTTVDSTLGFYRKFAGRHPRIGIVLQSRLFRTPADVAALSPLRPNVRLCIGIYRESEAIAFPDKDSMKSRLLGLLRTMWENGQYVGLATHDERVIRRALALARELGKGPEAFEVQMLLGVPRAGLQEELMKMGLKVRLYVPYGRHWYQYCLRRLEHNPEMASLVVKNLLRIR
ncbi:MAG: proline dehydrogenase family protein [Acidobacteria bacterium]|nr:proline dehydrogenase family protein [Acidobacteriota bacterium]